LVDEVLCKVQALGVRDGKRAGPKMLAKQAPQMPARYAQSVCKLFQVAIIQCTLSN
jgi:hypothetical protein